MERTLSQLLPGANKVENALRLRTKAFMAGLVQRRWTPRSKPKHGLKIITINNNYTILFLIRSQINNIIIKQTLTVKRAAESNYYFAHVGLPLYILEGSSTHYFRGLEHPLFKRAFSLSQLKNFSTTNTM